MVKMMAKRSSFPVKKSKEGAAEVNESFLSVKGLGFKKTKSPESHSRGYCKLCHADVKNFEAHVKSKHKNEKIT